MRCWRFGLSTPVLAPALAGLATRNGEGRGRACCARFGVSVKGCRSDTGRGGRFGVVRFDEAVDAVVVGSRGTGEDTFLAGDPTVACFFLAGVPRLKEKAEEEIGATRFSPLGGIAPTRDASEQK